MYIEHLLPFFETLANYMAEIAHAAPDFKALQTVIDAEVSARYHASLKEMLCACLCFARFGVCVCVSMYAHRTPAAVLRDRARRTSRPCRLTSMPKLAHDFMLILRCVCMCARLCVCSSV